MSDAKLTSEQSANKELRAALGRTSCPKCANEYGFAFGTCIECGWNYLDHSWHHITVFDLDVIPTYTRDFLIRKHEESVARRLRMRESK